jgi:hypothetical protein
VISETLAAQPLQTASHNAIAPYRQTELTQLSGAIASTACIHSKPHDLKEAIASGSKNTIPCLTKGAPRRTLLFF